jgi:hypothetical protein
MAGYSSLRNYGMILFASWFWLWRRRSIRRLVRHEPDPWAWIEQLIVHQRLALKAALAGVWRSRMEQGWWTLWRTLTAPAKRAHYEARARVGTRFAGTWLQPELHRAISGDTLSRLRAALQPGDVLLMRAEGKLTASLLPGFWAHAAIHLGHAQWEPHGSARPSGRTSDSPEQADRVQGSPMEIEKENGKEEARDRNKDWVIEAVSPCVRIVTLDQCLDADHVVVLRPQLSPAEIGQALDEAVRHLHKPYDFEFDFNLSSRLVCTGLVFRSFHGRGPIAFQLIKRLGHYTLTGDDVVEQTTASGGMKPVMLILRRRQAWQVEERPPRIAARLRAIRRGWRPLRSFESEAG